ncbi:MAG: HD domain-containing protein [Anaerolineae bacterium]|jgi:putative nucleotidyltransferase with HDIG domain/PAS domain S-box-containing protein|nr:HD domain-containing protein [Anaerolineae bacterium]MBT7070639.1 HD domain-containing protein [Anaerolineae bacterium]MBT7326267.1 HD domain-containing protein [Anaerolineae bacterium]
MQTIRVLFALPHLIALSLSAWVIHYAWKRKHALGVRSFIWYTSGQVLWIIGFIFELTSPSLKDKILWDAFEWNVILWAVLALPIFAIQYKNGNLEKNTPALKIAFTLYVFLTLIIFTNNLHGLIYTNPQILPNPPFGILSYKLSLFAYVNVLYSYTIYIWGIGILLRGAFNKHTLYRKETLLLALGFLSPAIGALFDLIQFRPFFGQSNMPVAFMLGNAFNAWNLVRFNIFRISPANRNEAFEAIVDLVVILDNDNIIVDINSSMLDLLGKPSSSVIGKSAKTIFANFPIPIKLYSSVSHARTETSFDISGKTVHYEMSIWPILNTRREIISRLYISHDITAFKELEVELRKLNNELERRVQERTQELADSYDYTLEGWAKALELRDKETEGHSRRVTEATLKVARAYGVTEREMEHIHRGAILHDIGKMAIPDGILLKPAKLTADERKIIEEHPVIAYDLMKEIPYLVKAMEIPYSHHERWDGGGYPQGLKGKEIPLAARIFAVVDVWDALRSERSYSAEWTQEEAIDYLIENANKHFDLKIVNLFLDLVKKGEIQ